MSLEGEASVIINNQIISITFFLLWDMLLRIFIRIQIFIYDIFFSIGITIILKITRVGVRIITDVFLYLLLALLMSLEGEASEFFFDYNVVIILLLILINFLIIQEFWRKINFFNICHIFSIPVTILFRITRFGFKLTTAVFLHMLLALLLSLEGEASVFFILGIFIFHQLLTNFIWQIFILLFFILRNIRKFFFNIIFTWFTRVGL